MRVLTLPQAIKEIRLKDPNSAITENMLESLIKENKIPYGGRGVRTIVELNAVIVAINDLLGFDEKTAIPFIRTVQNAALEIKTSSKYITIGIKHIRKCIKAGIIPTIAVGNRNYIAMQSFTDPYAKKLIYGNSTTRNNQESVEQDMLEQMSACISRSGGVPKVVRVRKEK